MMDFAVVLQRIFVGTKYKVRTNWCDKSIITGLEIFNFIKDQSFLCFWHKYTVNNEMI